MKGCSLPYSMLVLILVFDYAGRMAEKRKITLEVPEDLLERALAAGKPALVNVVGVREGKWTQNLLTAVKVLGLLAILALAVIAPAVLATGLAETVAAAITLLTATRLPLLAVVPIGMAAVVALRAALG